ncbi:hypothetical protein B0H14DRAFT_2722174 [Mycena olivaceomarginata]|nr:hypothetical protein B0H14DRAFT_2722174 [Mycena olivaceomarginata]
MDGPESNPDLDHYGPQLLAAAVPYCARWEYLTLHLSPHVPKTDYPRIDGPMPLLQHLNLWLTRGSSSPIVALPSGAPLLRTAVLDDHAAAKVILPWMQLTSLTLTVIYLHECVPVLQKTSNLVDCVLELVDSDDVVGNGAVTLPSLVTLTIKELDPATAVPRPINYLQAFVLPALGSLEIPERFLGRNPIDSLTLFISKSGCKLRCVDIMDPNLVLETSYRTAFPSIQVDFLTPAVDDDESAEL